MPSRRSQSDKVEGGTLLGGDRRDSQIRLDPDLTLVGRIEATERFDRSADGLVLIGLGRSGQRFDEEALATVEARDQRLGLFLRRGGSGGGN